MQTTEFIGRSKIPSSPFSENQTVWRDPVEAYDVVNGIPSHGWTTNISFGHCPNISCGRCPRYESLIGYLLYFDLIISANNIIKSASALFSTKYPCEDKLRAYDVVFTQVQDTRHRNKNPPL